MYWLGVRAGAWAAAVTFALCLVAVFVPKLALPLYLLLGAGVFGVCIVGATRPRPPDAVLATRWARRTLGQIIALVSSRGDRKDRSRRNDQP